jgi:hypothetical protein
MSLRKTLPAALVPVVSLLLCAPVGSAEAARPDAGADAVTPARSSIPRTYDEALRHFGDADGRQRRYKKFVTPSGNIYCALKVRGIPTGCEINEGAIKDPAVCSSNPGSKYVGRIEFHRGRAVPVCNTDTIRMPGAKKLAYGDIAYIPGWHYACLSERVGVTCINEDKAEGFFLHRGEYVIFNAG